MEEYGFVGYHLLANYVDCLEESVRDIPAIKSVLASAVKASGATILNTSEHTFEGGGFTSILLLSESHASIHTYPEHNACFIDLFTCGTTCNPDKFAAVVLEYFKPSRISQQILVRNEEITVRQ